MYTGIETAWAVAAGILGLIYLEWDAGKEAETERPNWRKWNGRKMYMAAGIVLGAVLAVVSRIYLKNGFLAEMKNLTLVMLLFPIAWVDYHKLIIPNRLILAGVGVWAVFFAAEAVKDPQNVVPLLKNILFGCGLVAIFFILGVFVIKNGIGMGDIKLMLLLALYQGFYGMFSSLFFSFLASLAFALFLVAVKKKKRKDTIPFAPSVLTGTYLSALLTIL